MRSKIAVLFLSFAGLALAQGISPGGGGGGAPSGAAGGDLSGTYPNPNVAKINGAAPAAVATSGSATDITTGTLPKAQGGTGITTGALAGFWGVFSNSAVATAGATTFGSFGIAILSVTETSIQIISPWSGTLRNLRITIKNQQSATGSLVFTVRTGSTAAGAADTALTCTLPLSGGSGGNITTLSDLSDTVAISAGDFISIKVVNNASVNSVNIISASIQLTGAN